MPKNKKLFTIFLFCFLFSFKSIANAQLTDQVIETIVGNFIDDGSSGLGGGPLPSCEEIDKKLKEDFGAVMKPDPGPYGSSETWAGVSADTPDCQTKRLFYRTLDIAGRSSSYLRLLKPRQEFTIGCSKNSIDGSSGWVTTATYLHYRNCHNIKSNFEPYAFLITHEVGHIMKQRNFRILQQEFPRTELINKNPNCFNNEGTIKTYNRLGLSCTSSWCEQTSESSAEAIALYVYNRKDGKYGNISNFRSQCPAIYDWAKNSVFGGYTFN